MTRSRAIFFSIFGAYHASAFLFTWYVDTQQKDFGFLTSMLSKLSLFKYGALLGVILFAIDFGWTYLDKKNSAHEAEEAAHENNLLKAKMYDLQGNSKEVKHTTPSSAK
jgi:hypothetical protein